MVETLQPLEYFPISRILPDPSDTGTYYVRAVVRNARTNATVATVDLESLGNHIFSTAWRTVADTSGQGLFITITTTVYDDSGYTTKSIIYGEEQDTFLVYDRQKYVQSLANQISALVSSGSDGVEVDYKKIRRIVEEVLSEKLKPIDLTEIKKAITAIGKFEKQDLQPVISALSALESTVKAVGKFEKTDLSKVLFSIEGVKEITSNIKIPEYKETDLSPVMEALEEMGEIKKTADDIASAAKNLSTALKTLPEVSDGITEAKETVKEFLYAVNSKPSSRTETGPKIERSRSGMLVKRNRR